MLLMVEKDIRGGISLSIDMQKQITITWKNMIIFILGWNHIFNSGM